MLKFKLTHICKIGFFRNIILKGKNYTLFTRTHLQHKSYMQFSHLMITSLIKWAGEGERDREKRVYHFFFLIHFIGNVCRVGVLVIWWKKERKCNVEEEKNRAIEREKGRKRTNTKRNMRWCCLSHCFLHCRRLQLIVGGNLQLDLIDDETSKSRITRHSKYLGESKTNLSSSNVFQSSYTINLMRWPQNNASWKKSPEIIKA